MNLPIVHRIDADDRIVYVNEAWTTQAALDGAAPVVREAVLGRVLWDSIADFATREIYQRMVAAVRAGRPAHFHYRCDTPEYLRVFEMKIEAMDGELVSFTSRLVRREHRPPIALLDRHQPRDERFVCMCSWCQRLAAPEGDWINIEQAVERLALLQGATSPAITHGICPACRDEMLRGLGIAERTAPRSER
ncbi:MAG TPA: hypothetical protein VEQ65_12100 [Opitutus sp.]|nr:hypothetical protein [Opitutus sp.]